MKWRPVKRSGPSDGREGIPHWKGNSFLWLLAGRSVWKFDLLWEEWIEVVSLPTDPTADYDVPYPGSHSLSGGASITIGDTVYGIFGFGHGQGVTSSNPSGVLGDLWSFNTDTLEFDPILVPNSIIENSRIEVKLAVYDTDMHPGQRMDTPLTVLEFEAGETQLLIFGGLDPDGVYKGDLWRLRLDVTDCSIPHSKVGDLSNCVCEDQYDGNPPSSSCLSAVCPESLCPDFSLCVRNEVCECATPSYYQNPESASVNCLPTPSGAICDSAGVCRCDYGKASTQVPIEKCEESPFRFQFRATDFYDQAYYNRGSLGYPSARVDFAMTSTSDEIYVFGGRTKSMVAPLSGGGDLPWIGCDTWKLIIATETWIFYQIDGHITHDETRECVAFPSWYPGGREGGQMIPFGSDSLLLFGGYGYTNNFPPTRAALCDMWVLTGGSWEYRGDAYGGLDLETTRDRPDSETWPSSRQGFAMWATSENEFYIHGGIPSNGILWRFDENGLWVKCHPVASHSVPAPSGGERGRPHWRVGSELYLLTAMSRLWAFDTNFRTWELLVDVEEQMDLCSLFLDDSQSPAGRLNGGGTSFDKYGIFGFGEAYSESIYGSSCFTQLGSSGDLWSYDSVESKFNWFAMDDRMKLTTEQRDIRESVNAYFQFPGQRTHLGMSVVGSRLYLFGGKDELGEFHNDLWSMDLDVACSPACDGEAHYTCLLGTCQCAEGYQASIFGTDECMPECGGCAGNHVVCDYISQACVCEFGFAKNLNGECVKFPVQWEFLPVGDLQAQYDQMYGRGDFDSDAYPSARYGASMVSTPGRIWLFAGASRTFEPLKCDLWSYEIETNLWAFTVGMRGENPDCRASLEAGNSYPGSRAYATLVSDSNILHLFGGRGQVDSPSYFGNLADWWKCDVSQTPPKWTYFSPLSPPLELSQTLDLGLNDDWPTSRHSHSYWMLDDDRVFIHGGWTTAPDLMTWEWVETEAKWTCHDLDGPVAGGTSPHWSTDFLLFKFENSFSDDVNPRLWRLDVGAEGLEWEILHSLTAGNKDAEPSSRAFASGVGFAQAGVFGFGGLFTSDGSGYFHDLWYYYTETDQFRFVQIDDLMKMNGLEKRVRSSFSQQASFPGQRYLASMTELEGVLYLFGGKDAYFLHSDFWRIPLSVVCEIGNSTVDKNDYTRCVCDLGFDGDDCRLAVCDDSDFLCFDPEKARCIRDGECDCLEEYYHKEGTTGFPPITSHECALKCGGDCLNGGTCSNPYDKCQCLPNFDGQRCEFPICHGESMADPLHPPCGGHGNCSDVDFLCDCDPGWDGSETCDPNCEVEGVHVICRGRGTCVSPGRCQCFNEDEWVGDHCEIPICYGTAGNFGFVCNSEAVCVDPNTCACADALDDRTCAVDCGVGCGHQATCTPAGQCECEKPEFRGNPLTGCVAAALDIFFDRSLTIPALSVDEGSVAYFELWIGESEDIVSIDLSDIWMKTADDSFAVDLCVQTQPHTPSADVWNLDILSSSGNRMEWSLQMELALEEDVEKLADFSARAIVVFSDPNGAHCTEVMEAKTSFVVVGKASPPLTVGGILVSALIASMAAVVVVLCCFVVLLVLLFVVCLLKKRRSKGKNSSVLSDGLDEELVECKKPRSVNLVIARHGGARGDDEKSPLSPDNSSLRKSVVEVVDV